MSQQAVSTVPTTPNAQAASRPGASTPSDGPIYERRSVVLTAKVLSAVGNAIFAVGLVGMVASVMH